jgi:hypothetical protein
MTDSEPLDSISTHLRREILDEMESIGTKNNAARGVRVGLAIAANIVARGRRLTAREKVDNLFKAIADFEAEKPDDLDDDPPYFWRDMKDVPKDQDVILYFSTGTCRVPLVARYQQGYMDPIGLKDWKVIRPIPGDAPTGWLPLIYKD